MLKRNVNILLLQSALWSDKSQTQTVHKKSQQEAQGLYAELFSFVYFKCLSEFLFYFYKGSTSMAFT